jgi:hypothetical protein
VYEAHAVRTGAKSVRANDTMVHVTGMTKYDDPDLTIRLQFNWHWHLYAITFDPRWCTVLHPSPNDSKAMS